ncbi:MAG: FHA domain-containing protein [Phycisphaerales bacterium]|nr:FHA domain-containing protein [Phycisphaerales bacterium]
MSIRLIMTSADGSSRSFPLDGDRTTIGRRRSCDLHVPLPAIAPLHCEITVCGTSIRLRNRDPESQTWHNGHQVGEADLVDLDRVRVGPVEFTVSVRSDEVIIQRLDADQ